MSLAVPKQTVIVSANSLWNIQNFRRKLIQALECEGHAVVVAAAASPAESAGVPEISRFEPLQIESDGMNPVRDAGLLLSYVKLLRSCRRCAILTFTAKPNIYGALAARLTGVEAIPNVSGLGTAFIRGGALQKLLSWLYRIAFRNCRTVFFQNPEDRELFLAGRIVRPEQAQLLPGSGVDLQHFAPQTDDEREGAGTTFLFVGRVLGDKGVREFADAARLVRALHPRSRFQILGFAGAANRTAISPDELAAWQQEGGVEYLGATDDVRPFLAAADAVVLPSYREGLPRSLLEAAAMARPLIASDVPGNREVVEHGHNGLLCEVRSASSLAEACTRFIALSPEAKRRMGQASRQMVEERFSEEKVIAAYLATVRGLVAGASSTGGA